MFCMSPYASQSLELELTQGTDYILVVSGHASDVVFELYNGQDPTAHPYPDFVSTADVIVFSFTCTGRMVVRLTSPQDYETTPWHITAVQHTKANF